MKFTILKRKNNQTMTLFINRFRKLYRQIPKAVNPYEAITVVAYVATIEVKFSFHLRKSRSLEKNLYIIMLKAFRVMMLA